VRLDRVGQQRPDNYAGFVFARRQTFARHVYTAVDKLFVWTCHVAVLRARSSGSSRPLL